MEVKAYLKNVKTTPKKLRFFLAGLKKVKPQDALNSLMYSRQEAGQVWYKAIKSALDNAINTFKLDSNLLKFKVLTVEEGLKLKRYKAGGRGTAKPFRRKFSHIKIVLEAPDRSAEMKKEEKKVSVKKEIKPKVLKTKNKK